MDSPRFFAMHEPVHVLDARRCAGEQFHSNFSSFGTRRVSSYLLIGFWFEKPSASNAAKKAFITNRLGDFGFLLGILVVWDDARFT